MKKIKVLSGLMAALMGILSFSSLPSVNAKDIYCIEVSKKEKQKLEEVLEKIKDETRTKESDGFIAKLRWYLKSICYCSLAGSFCSYAASAFNEEDLNKRREYRELGVQAESWALVSGFSYFVLGLFS